MIDETKIIKITQRAMYVSSGDEDFAQDQALKYIQSGHNYFNSRFMRHDFYRQRSKDRKLVTNYKFGRIGIFREPPDYSFRRFYSSIPWLKDEQVFLSHYLNGYLIEECGSMIGLDKSKSFTLFRKMKDKMRREML